MIRIALAALIVPLAGTAAAQDRPVWPPTKDATVTYVIAGANRPAGMPSEMKMAFSATQGKMRMDVGQDMYMITDLRTKTMQMVMPGQHMIMTMSPDSAAGAQMFDPSKIDKAAKKGTDTVAGQSCTVWDVSMGGRGGEMCSTAEGIMLRASSPDGGKLEATKVAYGAVAAATFTLPQGYQTMQMPSGTAPRRP